LSDTIGPIHGGGVPPPTRKGKQSDQPSPSSGDRAEISGEWVQYPPRLIRGARVQPEPPDLYRWQGLLGPKGEDLTNVRKITTDRISPEIGTIRIKYKDGRYEYTIQSFDETNDKPYHVTLKGKQISAHRGGVPVKARIVTHDFIILEEPNGSQVSLHKTYLNAHIQGETLVPWKKPSLPKQEGSSDETVR